MKKIIASLAAGIALGTGTAVVVAPAAQAADTPGCVSQKEFRQAKKGMKAKKVHAIFDTKGKRDAISHAGGYTFEIRSYRACSRFGAVSVGYENGKLSTKSAVF